MRLSKKVLATGLFGAAVIAMFATITGSPASADPQGAPIPRQLAGSGSDTTQDVMNALAQQITIGGVKVLGSYDAIGSATISPKSTPQCTNIPRPNGSGAGRTALINSQVSGGTGCFDFARSSSLSLGASNPGLTYIPFAVDTVTYAATSNSNVPKSLTKADLQAIYNCESDLTPLLPQANSGTRSYWLGYLGITEAQVSARPCIKAVDSAGNPIQEHDGRVLDANSLVPFSVGKWLTESTGAVPDIHGSSVLGAIDGALPMVASGTFSSTREVYNVVPSSKLSDPTISQVFVGGSSLICANTTIIQNYGFGVDADCGSTTNHTP